MTQSDDLTRQPHDIDELIENPELEENHEDPLTPETIDDDETEVGTNQVDELDPKKNPS